MDEEKAHYRLLATMIESYNKGVRNKLILANKAIVASSKISRLPRNY